MSVLSAEEEDHLGVGAAEGATLFQGAAKVVGAATTQAVVKGVEEVEETLFPNQLHTPLGSIKKMNARQNRLMHYD